MFCQRCGASTEVRDVDGRDRPVCTGCGAVTYLDPKLAVTVVIERDGRVLLGKRAAWTRAPGIWSFPAGFVDRGEAVEAAAVREAAEETGLAVELGPILGVFSEPGETVVLLAYPASTITGDPVPGDDLTELAWFAPTALPKLAFPHDERILDLWRSWRAGRAMT